MSLMDDIKSASLSARKGKTNVSGVLTTLIGEITTKEKTFNPARQITDDEIIAIVKKFIANNNDTIRILGNSSSDTNQERCELLTAENAALSCFVPQQLSDDQIRVLAETCKAEGMNMGQIMAWFKTNHTGKYDGKTVSAIVKSIM